MPAGSREQGCGPCGRCQPACDQAVGLVDRGPSPTAALFGSRVSDGLGGAREAGAHAPSSAGRDRDPSSAWRPGTHVTQTLASCSENLTPCSHVHTGTHKAILP